MYRPDAVFHAFITFCSIKILHVFRVLASIARGSIYREPTQHDVAEPPVLVSRSRVPLVGHLISMLSEGSGYLRYLAQESDLPMFTLPILGRRVYVAASPSTVRTVQKNHKTLSFNAIINLVFKRVCLFDVQAHNTSTKNDSIARVQATSTMQKVRGQIIRQLKPGAALDELVNRFTDSAINELSLPTSDAGEPTCLWQYVRTRFCVATANAFWGAEHPFRHDPTRYSKALSDFEADILSLFALPFPCITAPRAHAARMTLLEALKQYRSEHSTDFIRSQHDASQEVGSSLMAAGGLGLAFSAIGPVTTVAFWVICWIFADPTLLARVKAEVDDCISLSKDGRARRIDSDKLYERSPLLFACLAETLRLTSTQVTFRLAQEDTHITDQEVGHTYNLKKGGIVIMISRGMLDRKDLWGEDVDTFNPERFLPKGDGKLAEKHDITRPPYLSESQRAAFTPFASGVHACAGGHFSQRSIMAFIALFITSFHMTDSKGGSLRPPKLSKKLSASNAKPDGPVKVCMTRRTVLEDCRLGFV